MKISLNGGWHIHDDEGEFEFIGNVPGTVQGDLVDLGLIPHPYVGLNEELFLRLEKKSWEYTYEFEVEELSEGLICDLVFEGIDTLSYVYLNGEFLGKTEDMFLEYRFPVNGILKRGKNFLRVKILSPIGEPGTLMQNYGRLAATHEYDVRPYIRKAQYSYGWDWGARIAASGIWRDVFIEIREDARLFGATAYLENLKGNIRVTGYVDGVEDVSLYEVKVLMDGKELGICPVDTGVGGISFSKKFKKEDIKLWYPRGMGDQTLYHFQFILLKDGEEVYSQEKRIGLRTVKIVQEKDEEGESFIFYINERPVFAKGANWIPAENILSWLSPKDYEELIQMAYDANMNMLRVWGGGIYEDEAFYSKCDELGIMVWQDFMFACAEYPDHLTWFRNLANREVRENIVKLRHHPSIVLWCGNNENNWGFDEWLQFAHKVGDKFLGNTLYLEDFPMICKEEDPSRPYWPSSPYGGTRPNAEDGGDRHNWSVWSGWQDYTEYNKDHGRFLSEVGFQGPPDPETIKFFAKGEERDIFSKVIVAHNKQEEGPERIMKFIHNHFGIVSNFDTIVYLSQLNQAEAIKEGVEHWRARKYKSAGTIYWQLNDSWPVFSWSAVDYFKRPKALYWYTKRFYRDILPVCLRYDDGVVLKIINDRESIYGDLQVDAYDMQTGEKLFEKIYEDIRVGEDDVVSVDDLSFYGLERSLLFMKFITDKGTYRNDKLLANLREINLINPELKIEKDGNSLTINTKYPAYGVYILGKNPEENFFSLAPYYPKVVRVDEVDKVLSIYDFLKK